MRKRKPPEGDPLLWFDWTFQPSSDVVICSRCLTVTYPQIQDGPNSVYRCCNQIWLLQGRTNKRLPRDFWEHFTWGNKVPKHYREPDDIADTGEDTAEEAA